MTLTAPAPTQLGADCDCDCHREDLHCERCCLDPDTGFCPDCRYDTVFDPHIGQWWDLDDSDYQDAGSWEPTTGPGTHHEE